MTKNELVRLVKLGAAKPAVLREYARRVSRNGSAGPCEFGHFGCSLVDGGPCADWALAMAEGEEENG
jgi:hypothetical protein